MSVVLNKTPGKEEVSIPTVALDFAGFRSETQLEVRFEKDVLAVLKKEQTARDLIGAIIGLREITADLVTQLIQASKKAAEADEKNGCEEKCDYAKTCDLSVPPCILAEAGIPFNRPLIAYVDEGVIMIKGEEDDPLTDEIPEELLQALMKTGVNVEGLFLLLERGTVVYGK